MRDALRARLALAGTLWYNVTREVSVAEWSRHLVVAQETVGSNPIAHPKGSPDPGLPFFAATAPRRAVRRV